MAGVPKETEKQKGGTVRRARQPTTLAILDPPHQPESERVWIRKSYELAEKEASKNAKGQNGRQSKFERVEHEWLVSEKSCRPLPRSRQDWINQGMETKSRHTGQV